MFIRKISCFLVIIGLVACQKYPVKDLLDQDGGLHKVTFRIRDFQPMVSPMGGLMSVSVQPTASPGLLYFWSFNGENDQPDIGIDTHGAQVGFTSYSTGAKASYPTGYAYQAYGAGKAYSVAGLETLIFRLPIPDVEGLTKLGFDAGSSLTGPKDFIVSYSIDGGEYFEILSLDNPMLNPGGKNIYEFDLSALPLGGTNQPLLIRLSMMEGDRTGSSAYNRTGGTFKIDNFRLEGVYKGPAIDNGPELKKGKIHYHLFDQVTGKEIKAGSMDFDRGKDSTAFDLLLPEGTYSASFVADFSPQGIVFSPQGQGAEDFRISFAFDGDEPIVFGTVLEDFRILKDQDVDLRFERYYSEVTFEFTDTEVLSQVDRIEIREKHNTGFWPFRTTGIPGGTGTSGGEGADRVIAGPFSAGSASRLRFNQFLGKQTTPVSLEYELSVYKEGGLLLRRISVQTAIKNNIKLLFRGKLLGEQDTKGIGFPFQIVEEWGAPETVDF